MHPRAEATHAGNRMIDIDLHRKTLRQLLERLSVAQGNSFGAWCCIALGANSAALTFLESTPGGESLVQAAMDSLEGAWSGMGAKVLPLETLLRVDWDADGIEVEQEAAAQAATDLLAGIDHYLKWQSSRDVDALVRCAESVIDAVDYLASFESIPPSMTGPVLRELDAQLAFAGEPMAGTVRQADRLKHHEWLVR